MEWFHEENQHNDGYDDARFRAAADWYGRLITVARNPTIAIAGETLAYMLCVWSYTLIESMATDAWLVAVNKFPIPLANNILAAKVTDASEINQQPAVKLADLADFGFDLRDRMGTLLLEQQRVVFTSWKRVQEAYHSAFPNPASPKDRRISVELKEIFKKFPEIKALESVRNLIAHRGGKVDAKFKEEVRGTDLANELINQPLALTGLQICKFSLVTVECNRALLRFVDGRMERESQSANTEK